MEKFKQMTVNNINFKIKKMKSIITLLILVISIVSCKAQHIIPVEKGYQYVASEDGFMGNNDYVYVKDVNNILPKFIGTWKGTYNNKTHEFKVERTTIDDDELKEDILLLRYKITNNSNGSVVENTLSLTNESPFVMKNGYVDKDGGYVYSYIGKEVACGQNGWVFTQVYGTNNTQMKLFLQVEGETYPECTTGVAQQILPLNWIDLTKQ